ncbi:GNAT family N-acetyltransferase [Micromonospora halophytica]|uniref:Protein N-acetyltransferase, RimJ/RimL family n=1 Tax=Micromonospora halophytica TaxID=47864 RepID=A0A1C5I873_9ACTN|nr:GNAT family N-acetyltransferase [Micromonospora halophytica]SCG54530.1 Protein N-acetyltransferase, RimJ/RimL family [Micromonospora halophytica]
MSMTLRAPATASAPALVLRPWRDDDVDALLLAHRDPTLRARTRQPLTTPAQARRWVARSRQGWAADRRFSFAVCEAADDTERLVGTVLLKEVVPGRPAAEVGYWTAADARGRGVAPRALETVTRWAFTRFAAAGLTCLELLHQIDNPASCRVAEKTGYDFVEVLPARPPFPLDGHRHVRRRAY